MGEIRHKLIQIVWKLKLRRLADKMQYLYKEHKASVRNSVFIGSHPDVKLPPPELIFDANHNVDWEVYFSSGQRQATQLADTILKCVAPSPGQVVNVLEWGCGPGRIIRHLPHCFAEYPNICLYGSDCNKDSIRWCSKNVDGVTFVENELHPPIQLTSTSFDFIYAISIFTHLSETAIHQWFREIRRLLKPSGYFLFTTQGESFLPLLTPGQISDFNAGKLVARTADAEGKKLYGTFHPNTWIESALFQHGFKFLRFEPAHSSGFGQELWLVQIPDQKLVLSDS